MHESVQGKRAQNAEASASNEPATRDFPVMESVGVALEAGEVGAWSWDIKSNDVTWSGNFIRIHGLSDSDFDGKFSSIQRSIHPEDQPEVNSSIQDSLRTGKPYRAQSVSRRRKMIRRTAGSRRSLPSSRKMARRCVCSASAVT